MAAAVFGGSPRQHNRIANTHQTHHSNSLQQQTTEHSYTSPTFLPSHHVLAFKNTHQTSANLLVRPVASYVSTGTPISSSSHQYQQQHAAIQLQSTCHKSQSAVYSSQRIHSKRKTAVELLAESKPFYVKSEVVLDRRQQLNFRSRSGHSSNFCVLSPSRTHVYGTTRSSNRRNDFSGSDLLQTKLRKLLNADAKDCALAEIPCYKSEHQKYDTFSKYQTAKYNQQLSVQPSDQGDISVMFPSAFLSPQSLPPQHILDDDVYYGIDDPLVLTDDYRAISPPAEYAAADSSPDKSGFSSSRNYQRSYSHSHETASDDPEYSSPSYNVNSHKSLPDLHSQISRHSPHSEVLSCCSRGNRSNKSAGGSSLNRDSGESSGHYTHRSEPCCKQNDSMKVCSNSSDFRRDSGSSTQHSGNSYYAYCIPSVGYDCLDCRARFQKEPDYGISFATPGVPEPFQDSYDDSGKTSLYMHYEENKRNSRQLYSESHGKSQQKQLRNHSPATKMSDSVSNNQELSPPLGVFKRQKCLRFKHRNRYAISSDRKSSRNDGDDDRKPVLRSKSDISDRYSNRNSKISEQINKNFVGKRSKSESMSQLEQFFDRLGLNDEKFDEIYTQKRRCSSDDDSDHSSTVFFSDVSTVDSIRLPDSTETNQVVVPYRQVEPPSIVERNARIIKWLCNCRKLQLT